MYIREISVNEFIEFSNNHPLSTYHHSINYANFKLDHEYEYETIGLIENDQIIAGALVLVKIIGNNLYGYIPDGMLIDYQNEQLVEIFTKAMVDYYKKEGIVFIKINPCVPINKINYENNTIIPTDFYQVPRLLTYCGLNKLESNQNFESVLPRFNAIINLKENTFNKYHKNTKNKIRKAIRKGLIFEKADVNQFETFYSFVGKKVSHDIFYYHDYYNIFQRDNKADLFLVSIDYQNLIINSQNAYQEELINNQKLNDWVIKKPNTHTINKKLNSDKTLASYKNDISLALASNNLEKKYIAGALVIKHKNTATILLSGFDKNYHDFAANYFLYENIINYYKNDYDYLNLNGITADLSPNSKYYGLNKFKLGFKPDVYEYAGEYDLIINNRAYQHLLNKGIIQKEFEKK